MSNVKEILSSIDNLSKEDLYTISAYVGNKINYLNKREEALKTLEFRVGERVSFIHKHKRICGTIIKINSSSIKVNTDDGITWTVSPSFFTKI